MFVPTQTYSCEAATSLVLSHWLATIADTSRFVVVSWGRGHHGALPPRMWRWGQGTNGRQIMQIPVTIVPPEVLFLTRAFVGGAVCRMRIFCAYYLVGSGRHAPASSWISLPGASWCLGGSARGSGSFLATIPGALVGPLVITSWPLQAPCHQHHRTRSVESALLNPYH